MTDPGKTFTEHILPARLVLKSCPLSASMHDSSLKAPPLNTFFLRDLRIPEGTPAKHMHPACLILERTSTEHIFPA